MSRTFTAGLVMVTAGLLAVAAATARRPPGEPGADAAAPETQGMVELLARIRREADPWNNAFLNDRRIPLFEAWVANARTRPQELHRRFALAKELLLAGDTEDAIADLERIEIEWNLEGEQRKRFLDLMAISFLRLAEQENCIARHNADSCFVPIRGQGIHTLTRGSRGAIEYLAQALEHDPSDLASRWLLNIAYMTLGGYPDGVPQAWLIPERIFVSDEDFPRFYDAAGLIGLDVVGLAGGSIMEDFDGDGLLDIMASSWGLGDQLRFFRNNGDGTFTDRTREAGLIGIVGGLNMTHADYNNDGHPDVLVLRGAWLFEHGRHPNSLLKNNGDGTFEDVTEAAGVLSFHPTQTATWGDYDNDGWLDLFIGNESSRHGVHLCELYHNNGDGTFTECAAEVGVAHVGYVKGAAFGDYNNDGLLDLYLSVHTRPNVLFRNDGPRPVDGEAGAGAATPWWFTNVTAEAGVDQPLGSFPTWWWDYDNDGWLDILVFGYRWSSVGDVAADSLGMPHHGEHPRLYHNNRDGTFAEVSEAAGLKRLVLAMGSNYGDLDNDGYLDFYAGTGEPDYRALVPNLMFRNNGGSSFLDITSSGGFGNLQKGHGVAFGDIDNDGDQDLYVVMGGAYTGDLYQNLLFENPGNSNHWITLQLQGVRSNRAGMGARIQVRVRTKTGERDIFVVAGTGGSFGCSSLQQEIGLGDARSIRFVKITWPVTGETQVFEDVSMDQFLLLREGEPQLVPMERRRFSLSGPGGPDT